jgi:hypothetical protein
VDDNALLQVLHHSSIGQGHALLGHPVPNSLDHVDQTSERRLIVVVVHKMQSVAPVRTLMLLPLESELAVTAAQLVGSRFPARRSNVHPPPQFDPFVLKLFMYTCINI